MGVTPIKEDQAAHGKRTAAGPLSIGGAFWALSANDQFLRIISAVVVATGVIGLILLGFAFTAPGALGGAGEFLHHKAQGLIGHTLSVSTAYILGAVAAVMLLDLIVLGYRKSALRSLLHPDQSTRTDIYIFLFDIFGLWRYIVIASFFAIGYLIEKKINPYADGTLIRAIPSPIVQTVIYLLVYDFLDYWRHRLGHRLSWWWEVHLFHHAAEKFNIITVGRSHPVDLALTGMFVAFPIALLGAPVETFLVIMILRSLQGKLQHSMVPWDFGFIGRHIFISPIAHRIHHSPDPIHWDKNFGHIFVFWDKLFGTWYEGDIVNERLGLLHNTENKNSFVYEFLRGYLKFAAALFSKWKTKVGVLGAEEAQQLSKVYNQGVIESDRSTNEV